MLNSPEGLRTRQVALGAALAVGALCLHNGDTDMPVVQAEAPAVASPQTASLSPENLSLIQEQRDVPQRASRSHRTPAKPPVAPSPTTTTPPEPKGSSLGTFESTCYNLRGTTASGKSAGWGKVAVDPRVIPLGTRLHIEGYGDAVAADTGGLIKGRIIDIWKPTAAQCRAWGRHMVAVTKLP